MLAATETVLPRSQPGYTPRRLLGADAIGVALDTVIDRYTMTKHLP